MTKITYIPGEIANAAIDEHGNRKPVTRTQHIFDDAKDKNQAEVNAEVDDTFAFHQSEINALNSQNYVTVDSFSSLPTTGAIDTVYRVSNWDGTQQDPTVYSEYAWNGESYVHLNTKTQIGEVFDISAYHATGGELAKYADLAAALNGGANIPQSLQKGGMRVQFVHSVDNKYVQYRYMGTETTGNPNPFLDTANWQGVDEEPAYGSKNLIESGSVYNIGASIDCKPEKIEVSEDENHSGIYIRYPSGMIDAFGAMRMTNPIAVQKNDIIVFSAACAASIAIVNKITVEGGERVYTPIIPSKPVNSHGGVNDGMEAFVYKFVAAEDMDIVISYRYQIPLTYITLLKSDLLNIKAEIEKLSNVIIKTKEETITVPITKHVLTTSKYAYQAYINMNAAAMSDEISLKKGQLLIYFAYETSGCYTLGKLLQRDDPNHTYIEGELRGYFCAYNVSDGTYKQYYYYAEEDCIVRIFFNTGKECLYYIYEDSFIDALLQSSNIDYTETVNLPQETYVYVPTDKISNSKTPLQVELEYNGTSRIWVRTSVLVGWKSVSGSGVLVFDYDEGSTSIVLRCNDSNVDNLKVTVSRKNNEISNTPVDISSYDNIIEGLETHVIPTVSIASIDSNDNPVVMNIETQEDFDGLIDNIRQELSNRRNVHVKFHEGTFTYSDETALALSNYTDGKLYVEGNNTVLLPPHTSFKRSNAIGKNGERNIFDYNSTFYYKKIFVTSDGKIVKPDFNQGNGLFYFDEGIEQIQGVDNRYKVKVSYRSRVGNDAVGKTIQFTSWYKTFVGSIDAVTVENGRTYIEFHLVVDSANQELIIDSDWEMFTIGAAFKIHNYFDAEAKNTYYIDTVNHKIYLPDVEEIYECIDDGASFLHVESCSLPIVLKGITFVGHGTQHPLIDIDESSNISIINNNFYGIGSDAINIDGTVDNCSVSYNCFSECNAVFETYISEFHGRVTHNRLKKIGLFWDDSTAIRFNRGQWYCAYNEVIDFENIGIGAKEWVVVPGNESTYNRSSLPGDCYGIIEFNTVELKDWIGSYVEHELADAGAINPSCVCYPIIIRYNIINNYITRRLGSGIMFGGNCSQQKVYGNLILGKLSHFGVYMYAGAEYNKLYPNGVENIVCYNISTNPIMVKGGSDWNNQEYDEEGNIRDYSEVYNKTNNDCHLGVNLIGVVNTENLYSTISNVAYIEEQIIDNSIFSEECNAITKYNIKDWLLPSFIESRIRMIGLT